MSLIEAVTVLTAWALISMIDAVIPGPRPANRTRAIRRTSKWFTPVETRARRAGRADLPAPHLPHAMPRD